MEIKRLQFIRKQANDTLELTKGFTPEQRAAFSNKLKVAEELAGYVLELTNIEPHPGARWVKASERLPQSHEALFIKIEKGKSIGSWHPHHEMFVDDAGDFHPADQVEWLDESATTPQWTTADTKPEHNVGVLVFIPGEDNHITSGMWDMSNQWVLLDEYRTPEEEVTHWMPLPAFPEGYSWNEIPDDLVDALKKVAKDELGKRESTIGREDAVEFAKYLDEQRNEHTPEMWAEKVIWNRPNAFQEWLQYFKYQKGK